MPRRATPREAAAETARKTFEEGAAGDALADASRSRGAIGIVDALIGLGFCASKGEARRLIAGGGARVDGEKVDDEALRPSRSRKSGARVGGQEASRAADVR